VKPYSNYTSIREDIQSGKISCKSLLEFYLKNIEAKKELNAFLEVYADEARTRAAEIDQKILDGEAGRLAGMVVAIKDVICQQGHKASASSKILENFVSLYSATAVDRLLKEDAIIIGRLNCDEFAMGGSNENSAYGNVLNPLDHSRVPGGSSGGSAAAVKADLCHAALGTDTGGSVRQPASYSDLVGLKPSYGRISRYGLIAYASSFDQVGTFTHTVEDAALLLEIMAGNDDYDSTASQKEVPAYTKMTERSGVRFACLSECLDSEGLDSEVRARTQEVIDQLKADGHTVDRVSFPLLDYLVPTYYILTTAEASSNLSRFGGVLYGYRSDKAKDITSTFSKSRSEGFGKEVKRRIMLGTFVLSAGYYEAYYGKAQKMRRKILNRTLEIFRDYDYLILPTTPTTAFKFGANSDPVAMYLEDIFTVQANLTGMPAISLPLGHHSNKMPFGIQLVGKKFDEAGLLSISNQICKRFGAIE